MNQIIYNMPAAEYRKADGVANSDLKKFAVSGEHYIENKKHPKPPKSSQIFGTIYHTAIFEWPEFEANAVVMPEFSGKGSVAAREEWKAKQVGKIILDDDDYKTILAMRERLLNDEQASQMLLFGKSEVSAFYDDAEFEVRRKMRADFLPSNAAAIVDLKTTTDASDEGFSKEIYNFRYHQAGAYYLDTLNAICPDNPRTAFCLIAQEKEPPYAVGCYYLNAEALDLGRVTYRKLLPKFAACQRDNKWPGYTSGIQPIGVPAWAKRKEESAADVLYVLR